MTFGFREGLSTLDIRQSTNEDLETVRREVYVRRPSSRTSTNSGEETTPPGNSGENRKKKSSWPVRLPLLLLKDYVPLRSKRAMISLKNVRPLPVRRSKVFGVKEKSCKSPSMGLEPAIRGSEV